MVKVALSLPWLQAFHVFGIVSPDAVKTVLESVDSLKHVVIEGKVGLSIAEKKSIAEGWCLSKFASLSKLQRLELRSLPKDVTNYLLSFQYECLCSLEFRFVDHAPSISKGALKTLRHISFHDGNLDGGRSELVETLTKASNLDSLEFMECRLGSLDSLKPGDRFDTVTSLDTSFYNKVGNVQQCFSPLMKAITMGCFPCLRKLTLVIDRTENDEQWLSDLGSALMACSVTLQKLHLMTYFFLPDAAISMLKILESRCNLELRLEMRSLESDEDGREKATMATITCLTSLVHIRMMRWNLYDIEELLKLPKLKEVWFLACDVDLKKALELKEKIERVGLLNVQARSSDGEH